MRTAVVVALLILLTSACSSIEWATPATSDDATGGPGPDVGIFELSDAEYFEAQPGGAVTIRPAYQEKIGIICDVGWGRSCFMGVGVAKGAACFCGTAWGPIAGHAS